MPNVVQTGTSAVVDFLAGFGKGMVQSDVNRREHEKHNIQKQKWQQEMTAFAAQDEFRRLQNENSRLEIDMRKTQFADLQATKEQTKGFTAFMADAIGKAKGDPAERQSQLLEAYTNGAAQFTQADRGFTDKFIDIYAKIAQSERPKMGNIIETKDYNTGKKKRVMLDVYGDVIREIKGEENLEIVNDRIAQGVQAQQDEFDLALQAFMMGKGAVLGAEGQSLDIDSFMKSIENLDDRTKSEVTMDWIFDVRDRLWADIHETSGTLDVRLGRMLTNVVKDVDAREAIVRPYAKIDHTAGIEELMKKHDAVERAPVLAAMLAEFEEVLPEYEMSPIRMKFARIQNQAAIEIRGQEAELTAAEDIKQASMSEQVEDANKVKEEKLITEYMEAAGITTPKREILSVGKKIMGAKKGIRNWWDSFLAGQPEDLWGFAEGEREAKEAARVAMEQEKASGTPAMETLKAMGMADK